MSAFPYQHYHFHNLDSVELPIKNLCGFMDEPNTNPNPNPLSQFYPPELLTEIQPPSDNELSYVTKKQTSNSSSVMDNNKLENGEQVTQQLNNKRKKKNNSNASNSSPCPSKKQKKNSNEMIKEEEKKEKNKKKLGTEKEPPSGYIHVRARRGQATDSHSLAERVRREKISERMKILQRLVPGCDKVTGKALMLDEIINYVQSLQNQVEFLSMKLASVNPLFYDFGMDLDALTLRPDQGLNNYAPSISQQSTPVPPMVLADATTTTTETAATNSTSAAFAATTNNYQPVIDASASLLLQGMQESGSLMWDVDEQRQKFFNQSGLINNSLCSFH